MTWIPRLCKMRLGGFEPPPFGLEVDAGGLAVTREDWAKPHG